MLSVGFNKHGIRMHYSKERIEYDNVMWFNIHVECRFSKHRMGMYGLDYITLFRRELH